MAFGFFKKSEVADTIFMGGKIYTHDPEYPWADAVACKDGRILEVGDYESLSGELEGKHTEVIDLNGRVMLPGYMDTCGHPVLNAFKDSCLFLKQGSLEDILTQISEYANHNLEAEILFGYGYDETILKDLEPEKTRAYLDEINNDKPMVILGKSGFHCWINTVAVETVKAAAEEDEVTAITLPYLLGVLEPMDSEVIPETVPDNMKKYCERGFTSVFDCGAPDFFASAYQNFLVHFYQENLLKQRFFGSLLITRDVNAKSVMHKLSQYKTHCVELDHHINFNTLKLVVDRTSEADSISKDNLRELCLEAGDKGFDIHIDAIGEDAVLDSVDALESTRSAGYRKNAFTVAYDQLPDSDDLEDTFTRQSISETVLTYGVTEDDWLCIKRANSVEEAVDMLTIDAAVQLGISDDFGSIARGKHADFVIFDESPLEAKSLSDFKKLQSAMTVINGQIVYDTEENDWPELYSMLALQQYE
ncbi:MAG: amidohydrolase family protein [Bacillota bacterium]